MIRIYKGGDIKFDMTKVSGVAEKYYCHFYTKNVENYIRKTSDEATEEGIIPLNWTELQLLEQGVMYIAVYNLTDDQEFDDGVYNNTFVRTTQYYIVTNNTDLDVINKEISELTKNLNNEIQDRENADTILQENIDTKANASDVYTKAEVDEKIKDIDLSNYYTKPETDAKIAEVEAKIPTKVSELENDAKYITKADIPEVDLSNYYKKSETYSKEEVDTQLATKVGMSVLDNYYDKTEADAKYATQEVVNEEIAARIKADGEINTTLLTKADKSDLDNYYTKTEADEKYATRDSVTNLEVVVSNKVDTSTYTTDKEALEASIDTKANSDDVYTKDNTYSKEEVDAKLEDIPTDGYKHKQITEEDYEALTDKGAKTIYIISDITDDAKITHEALTAEEYAALTSKDAETLYIIKD